jgi:hypothetical protein
LLQLGRLTELAYNIVMNNIEILANIFSKTVLLKNYMLILNGGEAKAYTGGNGEWYVESEVTGVALALNDFEDIGWSRDIVTFTCKGEGFDLQLVQVLDLNQFRFAK